jgi:uncharacterized membrane protein YsdA (DUF1294 family)/cold shock CspA family protein
MRYQGKISDWKDGQGFGFIKPNGRGEKVFIHISAFPTRSRRPSAGDLVTYNLSSDEKKRFCATNARFAGEQLQTLGASSNGLAGAAFAALFCVFLATAIWLGRLPATAAYLYAGTSVIAFILYALDKSAAQNNQWRTRESSLHLFGLIGGWPGALLAQRMLRHKSRKKEFQIVFWATVVVNCCLLGWLLSDSGMTFLASLTAA